MFGMGWPEMMVILYEAVHSYRQIFTDGRTLPKDPNPNWFGYSVGRWEGDVLVVETSGFNDNVWLDNAGRPATAMRSYPLNRAMNRASRRKSARSSPPIRPLTRCSTRRGSPTSRRGCG